MQTLGNSRFTFYLAQLETDIAAAKQTDNPADYLYKNDTRTKLFMLQALARIYEQLHNAKKFKKLKEHFKLLEGAIGEMDYYDTCTKIFAPNKKVPRAMVANLSNQTLISTEALNTILLQKKWISNTESRIEKIKSQLSKTDWLSPEEEVQRIRDFYKKSIEKIIKFFVSFGTVFTNVETQVHEMRRKLRWLSINVQALQGVIQFSATENKKSYLKKYLTKEIVNSPYNILPAKGENKIVIEIDKNSFLALSYMINTLGKIKDEGLKIEALAKILATNSTLPENKILIKATSLAGYPSEYINVLLSKSTKTCTLFFNEKIIDNLIVA